jgi:glutaconate CoA-transferase, subunit A
VPAIRPDVAVIHAQKADRPATCCSKASSACRRKRCWRRRSIVTVEEIVDDFGPRNLNACIIPGWAIGAIAVCRAARSPSYAHGYYKRDNAFYKQWDGIARDRDIFSPG